MTQKRIPTTYIVFGVLSLIAIWMAAPAFGQPPFGDLLGADAQINIAGYRKLFEVLTRVTAILGVGSLFCGAILRMRKLDWGGAMFLGYFYLAISGVLALVRAMVAGIGDIPPDVYYGG